MTPKAAEEKLLARHKRVSQRKSGPASLQFTITEKQAVRTLAAQGHSQGTIASRAKMSLSQLKRAFESDPELREAFDQGLAEERLVLDQALLKTARDSKNPRQVQAVMSLLKSRHGYREGSLSGTQVNVQVNNNLPAPLDPRKFAALMKRIEKQGAPEVIEVTPEPRPVNVSIDPVAAVKADQRGDPE